MITLSKLVYASFALKPQTSLPRSKAVDLKTDDGLNFPALGSAHAIAYAMELAPDLDKDNTIIVNLSGRGDKDVQQVADLTQD